MADTTTITLQTVIDEIKLLRKDLRKVKSLIEDPLGEKAKARSTSNGFNKPLDISEELRKFLKLAAGEQISRSQVTKKVNEYVTEKGLKQGQNINMDASLKAILDPPADVQVTFLNIQKYINKHYIKSEAPAKPKKAAAAATPVAAPVETAAEPKTAAKRPTVKKA
jgi:upstream activation factor subunit UAF30